MRLLGLALLAGALAATFFLGRLSQPSRAAAATDRGGNLFVAGRNDVIRIPGIRTRCVVSEEAGKPDMLCDHVKRGRYELVLFSDSLFVYRNGNPDKPRLALRWKP